MQGDKLRHEVTSSYEGYKNVMTAHVIVEQFLFLTFKLKWQKGCFRTARNIYITFWWIKRKKMIVSYIFY